jgi:hypothetical protein
VPFRYIADTQTAQSFDGTSVPREVVMAKVKVEDLPEESNLTEEDLEKVAGGTIPIVPISPTNLVKNVPIAPGTNCGISVASNGGGPDIPITTNVTNVRS